MTSLSLHSSLAPRNLCTMPAEKSYTDPQTITEARSMFYDYWTLTRLHKFPLGSILIFWPCGKWFIRSICFAGARILY